MQPKKCEKKEKVADGAKFIQTNKELFASVPSESIIIIQYRDYKVFQY